MLGARIAIVGSFVPSLLGCLALGLTALSAGASHAGDPPTGPPALRPLPDPGRAEFSLSSLGAVLARHRRDLDLSDEQYAKLSAIWSAFEQNRRQAELTVYRTGKEAIAAANDADADLASIEAALTRFSSALVSLQMESVKTLRAHHGVVTPRQLELWESLVRPGTKQKDGKGST